tara:strand:- start:1070 stop:1453 length:384 start_codon:yes stop_codon:yes gene_type:complete
MEKTMNDQTFYYAKEILRQIQYADPNAMNCWGVIVGMNCFALPESKERRAGIKMNTNGFKHKGRVDIDLTWADDYTIKFYDKKDNVINTLERVYAPELCRTLDIHIESGPDSPVQELQFTTTVTEVN